MSDENIKLNTEPYKGVRDFFPEDMYIQEYIFNAMRSASLSFGYEKYDASILEPTDLYRAKTGDEIINEQTYSFKDRGDRDVTLRPEMTPTVARMVASRKRELPLPVRWYSIPNLFRYERPQKGRLREHFQLNVDIFGSDSVEAEIEVISVARKVLLNLGLKDSQFKVKISDRNVLNDFLVNKYSLDENALQKLQKLIDKKNKMDDFEEAANNIVGGKFSMDDIQTTPRLQEIIDRLSSLGAQIEFDPYIVRGFDYYTGTVFEFYDSGTDNPRAICGGGRFDDLLSLFGTEKLPTVGFGFGDVVARDILETYGLLPEYKNPADIEVCPVDASFFAVSSGFAEKLRAEGINVVVNYMTKNIVDKIKSADKRKVSNIIVIGEDEVASGKYKLKNLKTGIETIGDISIILDTLKK
jgi:histidyl-tRNA synthetase